MLSGTNQEEETLSLGSLPVLQVIGYKNSGKTTLCCKLISALSAKGVRVGSAKRDAHTFELDDAGTDSSKHLASGAVETVLTSQTATRMMRGSETSLDQIAEHMKGRVDLLLAEGFKTAPYPKIALLRDHNDMESLLRQTSNIKLFLSWQDSLVFEGIQWQRDNGYAEIPIIFMNNETNVIQHSISLALSLLSE